MPSFEPVDVISHFSQQVSHGSSCLGHSCLRVVIVALVGIIECHLVLSSLVTDCLASTRGNILARQDVLILEAFVEV